MTLAELLKWLETYYDNEDKEVIPEHVMRQVFALQYHLNRIYPPVKESGE